MRHARDDLIQQAAAGVHPNWRSRFLEACADQLLARSSIGDDDVRRAIEQVRWRMGMIPQRPRQKFLRH
jgi:hypothetical protein